MMQTTDRPLKVSTKTNVLEPPTGLAPPGGVSPELKFLRNFNWAMNRNRLDFMRDFDHFIDPIISHMILVYIIPVDTIKS